MDYDPYTSDELTPFVGKRCASDKERYDRLATILREGRLRASGIPGIGEGSLALLSVTGKPAAIRPEYAYRNPSPRVSCGGSP